MSLLPPEKAISSESIMPADNLPLIQAPPPHTTPPHTTPAHATPAHGALAYATLAYDRPITMRNIDEDGRLHVLCTPISKANICPYLGCEIPHWQELKLDPRRLYHLLRDPAELAKSCASFNALPVLETHHPVTAANPRRDLIIGATGQDARFSDPFLTNSLVIWDGSAIERILSGTQRELSCAYAYQPIMRPGLYKGQKYDGIMRQIRGSHVALVAKGRAGPDVLVADAAPASPPDGTDHPIFHSNHEVIMTTSSATPSSTPEDTKTGILIPEKPENPKNRQEKKEKTTNPAKDISESDTSDLNDVIRHAVEEALAAERKRHKDADEARRSVRPLVGDVLGMDSAEAIYRYALQQNGIDAKMVHPSALPGMISLALQHRRNHTIRPMAHQAQDNAALPSPMSRIMAPRKL